MKATISLAIFLMATLTAWADSAKDRWTVYQSYSNITEIEPAGTVCFVLASNSVFSYDTTDGLVQTYDKAGVMSDVGVSHIAWAKTSKRLVVVYTNSNIDLLSANGDVINAPDFYLKTTTLDKTINHIDFDGPYAYLSTAFGIVKLNTRDGAIMDTYDLGTNVSYTYVKNGYLYAESKERGRLRCKLTDNLLDKNNWVREDGFTTLREDRTNVQDNSCIHTLNGSAPCILGNDVTIGHSVTLHGCEVKDGALVGMGATVLDHAVVGRGAIVAAGALVLSNTQIGDGELWGGVPAKFIKKVDPEQAATLNQTYASHYIAYSDWYRKADADPSSTQVVTTSEDYRTE